MEKYINKISILAPEATGVSILIETTVPVRYEEVVNFVGLHSTCLDMYLPIFSLSLLVWCTCCLYVACFR